MTTEKVIEVLQGHKSHWERLLREKICDKTEGTDFINAIDIAIEALEEQRHIELAQDVWDNTPMDEAGDMW